MAAETEDLLANADVSDNEGEAIGSGSVIVRRERLVISRKLPLGVLVLERVGLCNFRPRQRYLVNTRA